MISGLKFVFSHPLNRKKWLSTCLKLVWWKCNQLFLHIPAVVTLQTNISCICYPESSYGSLIVYTTLPEYDEMSYVLDTLKKDDIFVDVGAGLGDYTLLASSKIKSGRIISFEPHSVAWKQLQQNIHLNSLTNIVDAHQVVVANKNGSVLFNEESISEVSHIAEGANHHGAKKITSIRLDSFLKKQKISLVHLLKIDVEGAESMVLQGAEKLLKAKAVKQILLEINPKSSNYGKSMDDVLQLLSKYNYSFFRLQNKNAVLVSTDEIKGTVSTQVILAKLS